MATAASQEKIMSEANTVDAEANKVNTVAFYKQALLQGDAENAFRTYAGPNYRQHNPTSFCTPTGMACRMTPAAKRLWIFSGYSARRPRLCRS